MLMTTRKKAEKLLEHAEMAANVLYEESEKSAKTCAEYCYRIVVAEFLFHIRASLGTLIGLTSFLLSVVITHYLIHLF